MSHEIDTTTGKPAMAYVGQPPWHGLGTNLTQGDGNVKPSLEVWAAAAGLEWSAVPRPLQTAITPDEQLDGMGGIEIPSHRALVRSDTKDILSVVGKNYKPVQPDEILGFFSDLVSGIDANFAMETAGSLRGGRKIWALAKGDDAFNLSNEDRMEQYLLMATSFDRSLPTVGMLTSVRVVCANTLRVATDNRSNAIRITHNCKFNPEKMKEDLGLDKWSRFADDCRRFADKQLNDNEYTEFLAACIAESNPHRTIDHYLEAGLDDDRFKELVDISHSGPGQNLDTSKGTLWGALNAVTHWLDFKICAKNQDNRLDSSWFGRGQRVKGFALELAKSKV